MSAIGPKRTSLVAPHMSAFGGKADMATYSASSKSGKAGVGLFLTGKILGHLRNSTTERYAHLADDPVRQANDVIGRRIDDVLSSPVTDPEKIAHKKVSSETPMDQKNWDCSVPTRNPRVDCD
jgi:hypothetical protein